VLPDNQFSPSASTTLGAEEKKANSSPASHTTAPTTKRKAGQPALGKVMCVSSAKSVRLHIHARSVVCVVQMIPNTREGRLSTGRSNGPDVICKPLPDRLCNSKATELVNNGRNINGKFTVIKNTHKQGGPH